MYCICPVATLVAALDFDFSLTCSSSRARAKRAHLSYFLVGESLAGRRIGGGRLIAAILPNVTSLLSRFIKEIVCQMALPKYSKLVYSLSKSLSFFCTLLGYLNLASRQGRWQFFLWLFFFILIGTASEIVRPSTCGGL